MKGFEPPKSYPWLRHCNNRYWQWILNSFHYIYSIHYTVHHCPMSIYHILQNSWKYYTKISQQNIKIPRILWTTQWLHDENTISFANNIKNIWFWEKLMLIPLSAIPHFNLFIKPDGALMHKGKKKYLFDNTIYNSHIATSTSPWL